MGRTFWDFILPGQDMKNGGPVPAQGSTALTLYHPPQVPAPAQAPAQAQPAQAYQDDGTGGDYDAAAPRPELIAPVLQTKGPLRWADRGNGDVRAYDGFGRPVYFITAEGGGRYRLLYYPAGTVYNATALYMGDHYRRISDAQRAATEDHIGRAAGQGY